MTITYELTPCIVCGAREGTPVADQGALRAELEALWAYHTKRVAPETPPRQLADRAAFSQPLALRLVRCARCGLLYRNPIERGYEVRALYADEAPAADVLEKLHVTQLGAVRAQARRLTEVAGHAGTVIEIGSYAGGFLAAARELGWTALGADVNPRVNDWVRARGMRVVDGEIADVGDVQADAVAFWNCFDQLADPGDALREARARLRRGGVVAIRVPNGAAYARLRAVRGVAAPFARRALVANNLLAFPYRYGFTRESLTRLLDRGGFRVVREHGDTLVPTDDRWTRQWARVEARMTKRLVRLLARAGVIEPPWLELYATRG